MLTPDEVRCSVIDAGARAVLASSDISSVIAARKSETPGKLTKAPEDGVHG
jgi:hypothetical protein